MLLLNCHVGNIMLPNEVPKFSKNKGQSGACIHLYECRTGLKVMWVVFKFTGLDKTHTIHIRSPSLSTPTQRWFIFVAAGVDLYWYSLPMDEEFWFESHLPWNIGIIMSTKWYLLLIFLGTACPHILIFIVPMLLLSLFEKIYPY